MYIVNNLMLKFHKFITAVSDEPNCNHFAEGYVASWCPIHRVVITETPRLLNFLLSEIPPEIMCIATLALLFACLLSSVFSQSPPYFGDDVNIVTEFMITTGDDAGLSTGNYYFAYSRSLNTGLFQRTCCYDSQPSDMKPISYIRNYTSKTTTNWYIGKAGSCTIKLNDLGDGDIYKDGYNNLVWLDPSAVRSPQDDMTIGVWPCQAWKFNWTNGDAPDEVVTYVRYDSNLDMWVPVMTDLRYELDRFGTGAAAWFSFFSPLEVTTEFLNQWQSLGCQQSPRSVISSANGVENPYRKQMNVFDYHSQYLKNKERL